MLDVALKEWAIVGDLLCAGRCCLLLRKGGVHEFDGPGRFCLEHDRFALFPAWEHEKLDWIKPAFLEGMRTTPIESEPAELALPGYAEVAGIWEVPSRQAFDTLDDLHPWTHHQIDMRFNYKPDRPLYALAVRAYRLPTPKVIPNRAAFAGCVSWVPLDDPADQVETSGAVPAMDDGAFSAHLERICGVLV